MAKSNEAKVKLTHISSGSHTFATPDEAQIVLDHPKLKGKYKAEALAEIPAELKEETKTGAATDKQADDNTK